MNLSDLVSISSYSSELELCKFIKENLFQKGIDCNIVNSKNKKCSLVAGEKKAEIAFVSHGDTYKITEGWSTDPLKLKIIEDKAYGLGSADMKAGLLAQINAFLYLINKGIKVKLIVVGDEEGISTGMIDVIKNKAFSNIKTAIFSEPSIISGEKNKIVCITKSPGRIAFEISAGFAPSHPIEQKNTIQKVCEKISKISKDWIVNSFLMDSNLLESPTKGKLQLNYIGYKTEEECLDELKKMFVNLEKNCKITIKEIERETPYPPPIILNKKSKLYKICSSLRFPIAESKVCFDMNYMVMLNIPSVNIGPIGNNIHSPNEWVSLPSIKECEKYLTEVVKKIVL